MQLHEGHGNHWNNICTPVHLSIWWIYQTSFLNAEVGTTSRWHCVAQLVRQTFNLSRHGSQHLTLWSTSGLSRSRASRAAFTSSLSLVLQNFQTTPKYSSWIQPGFPCGHESLEINSIIISGNTAYAFQYLLETSITTLQNQDARITWFLLISVNSQQKRVGSFIYPQNSFPEAH